MHSPQLNRLLALLSREDYEALLPHLELVGLEPGKVLFEPGQKDTALYFPTTCTISSQIELASGNTTDIFILGNQGMLGIDTAFGGSFFRAIVRKPGLAYRCRRSVYMEAVLRSPDLMTVTMMAMRLKMEAMAAALACRTFHSLGQQVASWLLGYGQELPMPTIEITHAQLANALGARRERVTLALNALARKGWLELQRGQIVPRDYPALHAYACNCRKVSVLQDALRRSPTQSVEGLSLFPKTAAH